jgi:pimeloyl-ACP methyl ester carboxylesterase
MSGVDGMLDSMKQNQAIQWTAYGLCLALSGVGACRSEFDEVRGPAGRLHIDDGGVGEAAPVVFIHSFAGDVSHWSAQLAHVRQRRRALAIDLRGHGGSDPALQANIPELAEDIRAVLDARNVERAVLVGHSLGGLAALEFAGSSPERAAGLYLVDSAGAALLLPEAQRRAILNAMQADGGESSIRAYWETLLSDSRPAVRAKVFLGLERMPPALRLSLMGALFEYDPRPALARYSGPMAAVITPSNDAPYALHRLRRDIPVERVNGVGHWLQLDQPEAFNERLDRFLQIVDKNEDRSATGIRRAQ